MAEETPTWRARRNVYDGARTEELDEPLLPRWFVLLFLLAIPVVIGVGIWAFVVFGPEEVPIAERRPPPSADGLLTTDVGQFDIGTSDAELLALPDCERYRGIRAGGSAEDRARIELAVDALCDLDLPQDVATRLRRLAVDGGEVRFALFQLTGVDSTLELIDPDRPRVLLNNRFARADTEPLWIAPLLVHDTTYLDLPVGPAESALAAREAEAMVCDALFAEGGEPEPSRACEDAEALLDFISPLRALEDAGFG